MILPIMNIGCLMQQNVGNNIVKIYTSSHIFKHMLMTLKHKRKHFPQLQIQMVLRDYVKNTVVQREYIFIV